MVERAIPTVLRKKLEFVKDVTQMIPKLRA